MPTMTRWSPLRDLDAVERRMRRLFEDFGIGPALGPAADMYETADELVVELEAPGYDEHELELEVAGRRLTIAGVREEPADRDERSYRIQERLERRFERTFELPSDVDAESLKATFAKGVLEVRAPKVQVVQARRIEIETV